MNKMVGQSFALPFVKMTRDTRASWLTFINSGAVMSNLLYLSGVKRFFQGFNPAALKRPETLVAVVTIWFPLRQGISKIWQGL